MVGAHSKAVDHRPPGTGHGPAPPRRWAVDLQEIHRRPRRRRSLRAGIACIRQALMKAPTMKAATFAPLPGSPCSSRSPPTLEKCILVRRALIATAAAVAPSRPSSRRRSLLIKAAGPTPTAMRPVLSYRRGPVRVPALASAMSRGSRPILTIWKTITARACCSWAASGPAAARRRASIRAEKPSTSASCGVAWSIRAASCRGAPRSLRLLLRMACSKAAAGAIPTTATRRLA